MPAPWRDGPQVPDGDKPSAIDGVALVLTVSADEDETATAIDSNLQEAPEEHAHLVQMREPSRSCLGKVATA